MDLQIQGSLVMSGSFFGNNSVTEYPLSTTAGGICINQLRFGYTSGNALNLEKFASCDISATKQVPPPTL
jgi:hypothetical protein